MRYFDKTLECMPRERLRSLQVEKLRTMLHALRGQNQFYSEKLNGCRVGPEDLQSVDDLARLPLTTKRELMEAQAAAPPYGTNATCQLDAYSRVHQTSGTTGSPLCVLDTPESWEWWGKCWGYVLSGAGVVPGDRVFVAFSFGPFIGFWAAVEGSKHVGALMIPGGGSESLQRLETMRNHRATVLCCTPTYALRLAQVAREEQFDLRSIPIRVTIHAGEPGANIPQTKARIEAAWNAKCFDHAGASEVGAHSFECEVQPNGIHVIESEFIVEVIDPVTTERLAPGEKGELVITNLGRIGFPVIRYRTGDLVSFNPAPCECCRTFGRFDGGVIGRVDDMVVVRGVNVFPSAIENLMRLHKVVDEFRVTVSSRKEMNDLQIEIELVEDSNTENIRQEVERTVHHHLSLHPNVIVLPRGTLPRYELKARRFFAQ